jgi:hypothetical protein
MTQTMYAHMNKIKINKNKNKNKISRITSKGRVTLSS